MPEVINAVIDVSHHNGNMNFVKAKEDGLLGVF